MVFEFAGAWLAGGEVTSTIRKGIIDSAYFIDVPEQLVFGMIAAFLVRGLADHCELFWLARIYYPFYRRRHNRFTVLGWFGCCRWGKVGGIVASWVVTPALAGIIAWCVYKSAEKLILNSSDPRKRQEICPFLYGVSGFCIITCHH